MLPQVNERFAKRWRSKSGLATRVSMNTNAVRISVPPIRQLNTIGLIQPIVWSP